MSHIEISIFLGRRRCNFKARLRWINTGGEASSDPCNAQGADGFFRQDGAAVAAIIEFVRSRQPMTFEHDVLSP
jgi:hypothetical protein